VANRVCPVVQQPEVAAPDAGSSVAISSASTANVKSILRIFGLVVVESTNIMAETQSEITFNPFNWNQRREDDNSAQLEVTDHVARELKKFHVKLNEDFKLCNVRNANTLLNLKDDKTGVNIRGGTDLIIVPFNTDTVSYSDEVIILFEIKTSAKLCEESTNQAILELVTAKSLTYQPNVLVVLTDVATRVCTYEIALNGETNKFYVSRQILTLNEMGLAVAKFLNTYGRRDPAFIPDERSENSEEKAHLLFKRQKLGAGFTSSLAWEHFSEMVCDAQPTADRAAITRDLLSCMGVERADMPILLHPSMYI
jgi:hypothetical protein